MYPRIVIMPCAAQIPANAPQPWAHMSHIQYLHLITPPEKKIYKCILLHNYVPLRLSHASRHTNLSECAAAFSMGWLWSVQSIKI